MSTQTTPNFPTTAINLEEFSKVLTELCPSVSKQTAFTSLGPDHISNLPTEILESIFSLLADEVEGDESQPLSHILSSVSHHWRCVAINLPYLWTEIYIIPPYSVEKLRFYLERSRACPIDLFLGIPEDNPPKKEQLMQLLEILIPHFSRCRILDIASGDVVEPLHHLIRLLVSFEMPELECFTFVVEEGTNPTSQAGDDSLPTLFSGHAPKLKQVRLGGPTITRYKLPLTNVTTFHLAAAYWQIPFDTLVSMLAECPALQTLATYDDVIDEWPDQYWGQIDLPHLKSLQIYGDMRHVSELLLAIVAPIENLTVAPVIRDDFIELDSWLIGHQSNYAATLRTLTLAPSLKNSLPFAASCFPLIENLVLVNFRPKILLQLFIDSTPFVWPNLQRMSVRNLNKAAVVVLKTIIEHRQYIDLPLKKLRVDRASWRRTDMKWFTERLEVEIRDDWMVQRENLLYRDEVEEEDRFVLSPNTLSEDETTAAPSDI
ncbi:hypothetical protein BDN72DRAFT_253932 [Pluteus cervinus]|uniref:Uncharacterized protein n=1 Tax=Pluteus cervinus TaxID=181527 RepID=A0ACD3AGN7_9AGAR|nr:hypothetical protein BDN72DRAFT_253932 [Pluteus cervinus]